MVREESDGVRAPLTLPNHRVSKGSTLRAILRQSRIGRDEFREAYNKA